MTVRGVLVDDKWAIVGWYVYGVRREKHAEHPDDILNLIGHDRPGVLISDSHPKFGDIQKFFQDYEKRTSIAEVPKNECSDFIRTLQEKRVLSEAG